MGSFLGGQGLKNVQILSQNTTRYVDFYSGKLHLKKGKSQQIPKLVQTGFEPESFAPQITTLSLYQQYINCVRSCYVSDFLKMTRVNTPTPTTKKKIEKNNFCFFFFDHDFNGKFFLENLIIFGYPHFLPPKIFLRGWMVKVTKNVEKSKIKAYLLKVYP